MPAYVIATVTIHDRGAYKHYEAGFMAAFTPFDGKVLVVEEAVVTLEGEWPATRTVVLEFPSVERAKAWHGSDAYQKVAQHRYGSSVANLVVARGFAAP